MRLLRPIAALISLCAVSKALHEADVGVVDWHRQFIGVPFAGSVSTPPSFHQVESRSLIITTTDSNVLAALEPEDGSILWRHVFNQEDRIIGYYKNGSVIATLSGVGGTTLRTFNAISGEIVLEKKLHPTETRAFTDPIHVGVDVVFSPYSPDIYVITNGHTVSAINGETGELKWRWTSPDQGSLIIHNKLVLVDNKLYIIGFAKSTVSYTLHVTILNSSTAEVLRSSDIPANILDPWTESVVVTHPSFTHPVATWLEKGILRYVPLTLNLREKPKSTKGSGYAQIRDVGVNGQVVVVRQNGLGIVVGFEDDQITTKILWEFKDAPHSPKNSDSIYVSSLDEEGRPYVGRIFWSHSTQTGSTDVFARHVLQDQSTESVFSYNINQHGHIKNVALDSYNPNETSVKSRLLLVSSTGSIQLWDGDHLKWTREEGLSSVVTAQFVEIPERVGSEGSLGHDSEEFLTRLLRHISSAQDFPRYAINFATRFATGSYAVPSNTVVSSNPSTEGLFRDPFGFRQIIVAATRFGKVYGIDSSNGKIIWSRMLGLGWAEEIGGQILPVKLHLTKTVSDGGDPEVVLVAQRRADNSLTDTVVFHLDAMTGRDVIGQTKGGDTVQGHDIISGPLVKSFFLSNDAKMAIMLDEFLQVHLYPDTPLSRNGFENVAHNLSFALLSESGSTNRVIGHQISLSDDNFKAVAYPTWSLTFAPGEETQAIVSPTTRGPIASFGKVLGNRTTLYKYLNPRLFSVLTGTPTKAKCGLYVLDSMKGTIVYRAEVNANARGCEIKTVLIDNWLVYSYFDDAAGGSTGTGAKGYRIVSVEFYEGQGIDEKTRSIELSAYSDENINFHYYEQSYILPSAVTALTSTTTRFGISNKDIVVATKDGKIHFIPRSYLNPRRPNRKPTAEEVEEMLVPYDPVISNDPKRVLSHNQKIANIQNIITSPALLESTSLIFAYGLDMFSTRMAPSGTFDVLNENFNKVQLVFTVFGLFVAILITRPMVRRKQLRERWYQ